MLAVGTLAIMCLSFISGYMFATYNERKKGDEWKL